MTSQQFQGGHRKGKSTHDKDVVSFSVRAQDFLTRNGGFEKSDGGDFSQMTSVIGGKNPAGHGSVDTTDVSANEQSTFKKSQMKSIMDQIGPIQLPKINEENQSPFKGFIDISVASQKIRKSMATQG